MSRHGLQTPRGMTPRGTRPEAGRFGEMFPDLSRLISHPSDLEATGALGGPMDEGVHGAIGLTSTPLGYVFLGQFVDHDITLDVTSSLDRVNDAGATRNFRTPVLDLDCVYGAGPEASRHLYYRAPPSPSARQAAINGRHLLTLGSDFVRALSEAPDNPNRAALIGDFRNDENRIVSQVQLTMHYFHNAVVDHLLNAHGDRDDLFEEAQQVTRWHYQWVVVHDFLVRMVGQELVEDILCNGRKIYDCTGRPFIPIEFSVAAYRFGHTMVTMALDYNDANRGVELFGPQLGNGFTANTAGAIDWQQFFGGVAQSAGPVDMRLASDLLNLPFMSPGPRSSLATRNLLRGQAFRLPSGQQVHGAISAACGEQLAQPDLASLGLPSRLVSSTPLWLYILAEGGLSGGQQLGPVGGRIVAEVLIGLLECDPTSYLGGNPSWRPDSAEGTWDMEALVRFAGYGT